MSHPSKNRRTSMTGGKTGNGSPFFSGAKKAPMRKMNDSFFQPKMVQRLATGKEDEKLSTNDSKMEKDKEEPQKPAPKH